MMLTENAMIIMWMVITAVVMAAAVSLFVLFAYLRRRWAYRRVRSLSYEDKVRDLDEALYPFGFRYVSSQDVISSGMYPWQREMGYCRQYDEAAPAMFMTFHSEPVYFNYQGKRWLIELWKGQYGCTTGAEIGVYVNEAVSGEKDPARLFYSCVGDENRLKMHFRLWKDGQVILERNEMHWWLTGFVVGEYSRPEELSMEINITFPDMCMRKAFYRGLLRAGYRAEEIYAEQNNVSFLFDVPRSEQPSRYRNGYLRYIRRQNRKNCRRYRRATRTFESTLDKISFLGYCFPLLYRKIIHLGARSSQRRLYRCRKRKLRG